MQDSSLQQSIGVTANPLVNQEDVMECIRSFCNDQQIDLNTRLLVLEELKDSFKNISDQDLILLLIYKVSLCHFNTVYYFGILDHMSQLK